MAESAAFQESSFQNSRGLTLRTFRIVDPDARGLLVISHGYGDYGTFFARELIPLAKKHHFSLFTMDLEGHGRSDGLRVHIQHFQDLVNDFSQYTKAVAAEFSNLPLFVVGESMGGAVVLLSTMEGGPLAGLAKGMVLMAPMCSIADEMKPPGWQITILRGLAKIGPKWAITPVPDLMDQVFKDKSRLAAARADPLIYQGKARLHTALELLRTTEEIAAKLTTVSIPFIVVHGGADTVTDPAISQLLYDKASSKDKTIRIFDGMWHALLAEPDGGDLLVSEEIARWLEART